ncbi:MAG TPA: class I SAM-dependent methyltransferase, partial [bacterium]|nr:class I SAM-dependent methyltransferase [bacterium]
MKPEAYENDYKYEKTHWWYQARNRIVTELIRHDVGKSFGSILDFGCGTGNLISKLSTLGDVTGCDKSNEALEFCKKKGFRNIRHIKNDDLSEMGKYDLITLLDVIEHVDDDVSLLKKLADHLEPGGKIIITAPAYMFFWSGEDYVSEHKRRYVRKQLSEVVAAGGLKVVRASYFNTFLFVPVLLSIKLKIALNPESKKMSSIAPVPKFINAVLRMIFTMELP